MPKTKSLYRPSGGGSSGTTSGQMKNSGGMGEGVGRGESWDEKDEGGGGGGSSSSSQHSSHRRHVLQVRAYILMLI